jgi:hypothetical protein
MTFTVEPIGRSAGVLIPGRNPEAEIGASLSLNTTQAYELMSSKPSGATD